MKLTIIAYVLLGMPAICTAMHQAYTMPDALSIRLRLRKIKLDHCAEHTSIIELLAGQQMYIAEINDIVEQNLSSYKDDCANRGMPASMVQLIVQEMEKLKPVIIKELLRDEHNALKVFEDTRYIK